MGKENRFVPNDSLIEEFMDLPELLARVENDRELLTELLVMFRNELPGLLNILHRVIDLGDLSQAARVAHTLKGMSANLSLRRGTALIKDVEQAAQIGDISLIKNRLVPLDSEIAAFLTAIDAFTVGM
jgi:two-component system, sensor histidine kinase and response regulator